MKEDKLVELSIDFAVKIIKLCDTIKGHYSIVNQLERSATSIGATFVKRTTLTEKMTLLQSFKYHLKSAMKPSIGWNFL